MPICAPLPGRRVPSAEIAEPGNIAGGRDSLPCHGRRTLKTLALYLAVPEATPVGEAEELARGILSTPERERADRLKRPEDRHASLLARALVRLALSDVIPVRPEDWKFETDARGRPAVAFPVDSSVHFSLSHTQGLIAVLLARSPRAAVDVESIEALEDLERLSREVMDPQERRHLMQLPYSDRSRRFLEAWTLKEAYLKARGLGLEMPLSRIRVSFTSGRTSVRFDPEVPDDPGDWQFHVRQPTPRHVLGTAIAMTAGRASDITFRAVRIRARTGEGVLEEIPAESLNCRPPAQ